MKIILLHVFIFTTLMVYSQKRTCGMQEYMEEQMQSTDFKNAHKQRQQQFEANLKTYLKSNKRFFNQTYVIPVAVHFPEASENDRACLEALAQNQIAILNADYSASNTDVSNWDTAKTHYPGVTVGNCNLEFVIATKNHPENTDPDLVEGNPAVTIGYNFGGGADSDTKWAGYFNFVVKPLGGGILGYSILGGDPRQGHSVVMTSTAFGSGSGCSGYTPSAPYNLGRTVTHEVGHHYNLNHTWGTGQGDTGTCQDDDGVADTPEVDAASYSCPSAGSVTKCGNKALTMNFMDYVNDACMYMFTQGQADRVNAYMSTISQYYNQATLTVDSLDLEKTFVVYPNPVKDNITLTFTGNLIKNNAKIELLDMLGKVAKATVVTTTLEDYNLNVSNLEAGLYLLRVLSEEFSITKKIIITD